MSSDGSGYPLDRATLVFRGLGALGAGALDTWVDSTRVALALMFLFTAATHS
jgi:hypothetical protein